MPRKRAARPEDGNVKLHPMALRITQMQRDKLDRLRAVTGLAIREHVRRAIDEYLEKNNA